MDMMNNADALPTCPQLQQKQQQTADRNWLKLTHTTARRRKILEAEFFLVPSQMPALPDW
jgi:hypothetical protein